MDDEHEEMMRMIDDSRTERDASAGEPSHGVDEERAGEPVPADEKPSRASAISRMRVEKDERDNAAERRGAGPRHIHAGAIRNLGILLRHAPAAQRFQQVSG